MRRLVLIGVLLGAASGACGATDDRPRTLAYITDTILAPTCAAAQCHSAFKRQVGDQFDTVEATRVSMVANNLVDTAAPTASFLYRSITTGVTSMLDPQSGTVRMPFDAPMPDADVQLILAWIEDGAPGAQCIPNAEGRGCSVTSNGPGDNTYHVVECPDGNIGAVVMDCPTTPTRQVCSPSLENGTCVTP